MNARPNRGLLAAAFLPLALLLAAPALADPEAAREETAVNRDFRREFDAGRYEQSLPLAEKLVALMEADPDAADQLPTAYNNLGVAQLRSGRTDAAEASFGRSLDLLEQTQGIASRRMIAPLAGLGAVYASRNQHARAVEVLQRAVAISRRADGLFNLQQLDLLDALVTSYEALGAYDAVEGEHRYALQVVMQQYGNDDPRTLPATVQLAQWYEKTGRYAAARALWGRSAQIGAREGDGRNAATINGLLGITRCHRLQFVRDPESLVEESPLDPFTGRPESLSDSPLRHGAPKLERNGEAAAEKALQILEGTPDPPRELLARTLLELGDWFTTELAPDKARPYYERAWPLLQELRAPGEENPLATPRPVFYRPPPGAMRNLLNPDVRSVARRIDFSLQIAATGEVTGVTQLSSEAQEGQDYQFRRALDRAWFSPRFENGVPLATENFPFTEYWHDVAPVEPAAPETGTPADSQPEAPPAKEEQREPEQAPAPDKEVKAAGG